MKIIVNGEVGTFRLSDEALHLYRDKSQQTIDAEAHFLPDSPANPTQLRTDPLLVEIVEQLGQRASADCSQLEIVEVPDGSRWHIVNVCGIETVIVGDRHQEGKAIGHIIR